jgi:hypothetical protein
MTKRTYGLLAGVLGIGAWLYSRRRTSAPTLTPARERGTVIFDNAPIASGAEGLI